ncbi:MAG TPA: cbb3-type cytochrome c oxidase subunit I, partial [Polyangiales bacterium]|nr:cbb3-type cytochrome c oxidase subunit I [Polyangiales bacterium]
WFPKIVGRVYPARLGLASAALVVLGFFCTFAPQFLLGNAGMPRRYATYPEHFQWLHVMSSGGALVLAAALVLTLGYLLFAAVWGERAEANPWHSSGFEWRTASPPPRANFSEPPNWERGAYDYRREED